MWLNEGKAVLEQWEDTSLGGKNQEWEIRMWLRTVYYAHLK